MIHETDARTSVVLTEIEKTTQLGTHGHPELDQLRQALFGEQAVPPCALRWELIAFSLYLADEQTHWGTMFGPCMSTTREDGSRCDSPPIESITAECLDYWQSRMMDSGHPLLRAHYADLVWDLSKRAANRRPPILAPQTAVDSYLDAVVNDRIDPPGPHFDVVNRMLTVCVAIGDDTRLENVCQSLISYAGSGDDEDETKWRERDLFPLFIGLPKKKWPLDSLKMLATRLRIRLEAIPLEEGKQWPKRTLALPLADFYWKSGQREEAHAVLRNYGASVLFESTKAKALMAVAWMEQLFELYQRYELHADAQTVLKAMQDRQPDLPSELIPLKTPVELKQSEIEQWLDSVIRDDLEQALLSLVMCFHPQLEDERKQLRELEKAHPMLAAFGSAASIVDHEGRTVARIEDEDGKLIRHITTNMQFADVFLQFAFPRLVKKFNLTPAAIVHEITKSPVWSAERVPILERGIKAYLENDALVAIHLLIPEIEAAIRKLAGSLGIVLQKPHRSGGYVLKNLDDLLREEAVVVTLTEDTATYLRALLTDQRGWNLRNNVCHGLSTATALNQSVMRRLMLIAFLLGLLRRRSESSRSDAVDAQQQRE